MSQKLKDQLIRLGEERPDLRNHLRPILDSLTASRDGYLVSKTYSTTTPESASTGDVAGRGYVFEDKNYETLDDVVDAHGREHTWIHADVGVRGRFEVRSEAKTTDFRTGKSTEYSLFVKKPNRQEMTEEELDYLFDNFNVL